LGGADRSGLFAQDAGHILDREARDYSKLQDFALWWAQKLERLSHLGMFVFQLDAVARL
jgi:hypothetical protein